MIEEFLVGFGVGIFFIPCLKQFILPMLGYEIRHRKEEKKTDA